ncbi:hypothetical protein [Streptomyces hydrogenans]|uniref:hypothetical protein n=1 Tax=Streptomyces hydrogenans TaxID=1873719 RepID=UPI003808082A
MSAPTPTGPQPEDRSPELPAFGQPSPALLARADRGYARFLAAQAAPADTRDHDQDAHAAGAR